MRASWLLPASSAEPRRPRSSGVPVYFRTCRLTSADGSGTALTIVQTLNCALLEQAELRQWFHENHLLACKEALASTLKLLKADNRRSGALICEAELRAVTNELLAQGAP